MEHRGRASNDERTLSSACKAILLGIFASTCLAYPLWLTTRNFATYPILSAFEFSSVAFDAVYGLLFLATFYAALRAAKARAIWAFSLIFFVGLLLDQFRWTPFYLQYAVYLVAIALELSKRPIQPAYALNALRLGTVLVYFWAGVHKLNFNYIKQTFPWFITPITKRLPNSSLEWLPYLGIISPSVEIALALLLIPRSSRLFGLMGLIVMHLGILWCLGPLGHNYGMIVWPWNIAMCYLLWTLFRDHSFRLSLGVRRPSHWLVGIALGLLPTLNLLNRWDSNLAMHMYSGNTATISITVLKQEAPRWPRDLQSYLRERDADSNILDFDSWAWTLATIGNIPTPEIRVYQRLVEYLCQRTNAGDALQYELTEKRGYTRFARNSGKKWTGTCSGPM